MRFASLLVLTAIAAAPSAAHAQVPMPPYTAGSYPEQAK